MHYVLPPLHVWSCILIAETRGSDGDVRQVAQHVGDYPDDVYRGAVRDHLRHILPKDALR